MDTTLVGMGVTGSEPPPISELSGRTSMLATRSACSRRAAAIRVATASASAADIASMRNAGRSRAASTLTASTRE